jgi:hypothetical protein
MRENSRERSPMWWYGREGRGVGDAFFVRGVCVWAGREILETVRKGFCSGLSFFYLVWFLC